MDTATLGSRDAPDATAAAGGDLATPSPTAAPPPRSRRDAFGLLRAAGAIALKLTVVAAALVFATLVCLPLFGYQILIVTSGSMEPLLSAGDAAVIERRPVHDLGAGDVITFQGYGSGRLVTHRIVQPVHLASGLHFQTKGDANVAPDPDLAPADGVVGPYVAGVPGLGRLLMLLHRSHTRMVLVGLPTAVILAGELRFLLAGFRSVTAQRAAPRVGALIGVALVLVVAVTTGVTMTALTGAVMTDADPVTTGTFATQAAFGSSS